MIPNIIRLQQQMKEMQTIVGLLDDQVKHLENLVTLQHAHVENLIERVYELEGSEMSPGSRTVDT